LRSSNLVLDLVSVEPWEHIGTGGVYDSPLADRRWSAAITIPAAAC